MKNSRSALVTIVSAFYNRGYCAQESVQSLIDQTYENIEIILIDDESKDNTLEILKNFESDRVKVISHKNKGLTRSFKEALESANGEFIAIHGSGDFSFPERIEKQVEYLLKNPSIGVVGCGREIYCEASGNIKHIEKEVVIKKNKLLDHKENIFSHGEVLMRANLYRQVGGYREVFKYTQDYDLWLRINELADVATFSKILYREYSRKDGIRNNTDKVVDQRSFFILAKLSARSRKESNTINGDILNTPYDDPFDLLITSRCISKALIYAAFVELVNGNKMAADKFIKRSRKYPLSLKGVLVALSLRYNLIGRLLVPIGRVYLDKKTNND